MTSWFIGFVLIWSTLLIQYSSGSYPACTDASLCSGLSSNTVNWSGSYFCCPNGAMGSITWGVSATCSLPQTCTSGSSGSSGSTTQPCSAGTYSGTGNNPCYWCNAGTYSASVGATSCSTCPSGTTSTQGSSSCTATPQPCSPGSYSSTGKSPCASCAAGKYSVSAGATTCSTCPSGTTSAQGSTSCTATTSDMPCSPGSYSSTGFTPCSVCAAGTYQGWGGETSCSTCPSGTTSSMGSASCSGNSNGDDSSSCAGHRCGALCSRCCDGFVQQVDGRCVADSSSTASTYALSDWLGTWMLGNGCSLSSCCCTTDQMTVQTESSTTLRLSAPLAGRCGGQSYMTTVLPNPTSRDYQATVAGDSFHFVLSSSSDSVTVTNLNNSACSNTAVKWSSSSNDASKFIVIGAVIGGVCVVAAGVMAFKYCKRSTGRVNPSSPVQPRFSTQPSSSTAVQPKNVKVKAKKHKHHAEKKQHDSTQPLDTVVPEVPTIGEDVL